MNIVGVFSIVWGRLSFVSIGWKTLGMRIPLRFRLACIPVKRLFFARQWRKLEYPLIFLAFIALFSVYSLLDVKMLKLSLRDLGVQVDLLRCLLVSLRRYIHVLHVMVWA